MGTPHIGMAQLHLKYKKMKEKKRLQRKDAQYKQKIKRRKQDEKDKNEKRKQELIEEYEQEQLEEQNQNEEENPNQQPIESRFYQVPQSQPGPEEDLLFQKQQEIMQEQGIVMDYLPQKKKEQIGEIWIPTVEPRKEVKLNQEDSTLKKLREEKEKKDRQEKIKQLKQEIESGDYRNEEFDLDQQSLITELKQVRNDKILGKINQKELELRKKLDDMKEDGEQVKKEVKPSIPGYQYDQLFKHPPPSQRKQYESKIDVKDKLSYVETKGSQVYTSKGGIYFNVQDKDGIIVTEEVMKMMGITDPNQIRVGRKKEKKQSQTYQNRIQQLRQQNQESLNNPLLQATAQLDFDYIKSLKQGDKKEEEEKKAEEEEQELKRQQELQKQKEKEEEEEQHQYQYEQKKQQPHQPNVIEKESTVKKIVFDTKQNQSMFLPAQLMKPTQVKKQAEPVQVQEIKRDQNKFKEMLLKPQLDAFFNEISKI